jgi:hypothetical protein
MGNTSNNNFFVSVANHNLERFHSECLAWLFNEFPEYAQNFICQIELTKDPQFNHDIDFQKAFTELDQLDLVLYYTAGGKDRAVIIENKVKAAEGVRIISSTQKAKQYFNESDLTLITDRLKGDTYALSQTEFYFLRKKTQKVLTDQRYSDLGYSSIEIVNAETVESKKKKNGEAPSLIIRREDCHFIFLIPAKVNKSSIETWCENLGESFNVNEYNTFSAKLSCNNKNPWLTITYADLLEDIESLKQAEQKLTSIHSAVSHQEIIALRYIQFLHGQSAVWQKELNGQFEKYESNKFGAAEYLRVLASLLRDELNQQDLRISVSAGSSNSGDPVMDIIISENVPIDQPIVDRKKLSKKVQFKCSVGIQIQGEKVKLFMAIADYYNEVGILNKDEYDDTFLKLMRRGKLIATDEASISATIEGKSYKLKKVLPKHKSFMNYSFLSTLTEMSGAFGEKPIHATAAFLAVLVRQMQKALVV